MVASQANMSKYTFVGQLPRHLDVLVDSAHTHTEPQGFVPAIWFGLVSYPGRAWGCTVLLESGAIYRNLPPHALAFRAPDDLIEAPEWGIQDAQMWNCAGHHFTTIEYDLLAEHRCVARIGGNDYPGDYLFTITPFEDAWHARPKQAKEFVVIQLNNGRLTIQPTNRVIFEERAFTTNRDMEFPKGLRRQTEVWSCE